MKSSFFVATLLLIHAPIVASQCATGVNAGGGNCVPPDAAGMPGHNGSGANVTPREPAPIWADQWGAIALDRGTGQAGTVVNKESKSDAVRAAMHDCEINGSRDCQVILTYYNQCAAVALGEDSTGVSNNPSEDDAKTNAMQTCRNKSATCKVVYSACSIARRVN